LSGRIRKIIDKFEMLYLDSEPGHGNYSTCDDREVAEPESEG
jgi:hypothetical protein